MKGRTMQPKGLFYITHLDNLHSIFEHGILSYDRIKSESRKFIPIFKGKNKAKEDINQRAKIYPLIGKSNLLSYASLFFQPRNPLLYRAILEIGLDKLAILEVADTVLSNFGVVITDGKSTEALTQFYPSSNGLKRIKQLDKTIHSD